MKFNIVVILKEWKRYYKINFIKVQIYIFVQKIKVKFFFFKGRVYQFFREF